MFVFFAMKFLILSSTHNFLKTLREEKKKPSISKTSLRLRVRQLISIEFTDITDKELGQITKGVEIDISRNVIFIPSLGQKV